MEVEETTDIKSTDFAQIHPLDNAIILSVCSTSPQLISKYHTLAKQTETPAKVAPQRRTGEY